MLAECQSLPTSSGVPTVPPISLQPAVVWRSRDMLAACQSLPTSSGVPTVPPPSSSCSVGNTCNGVLFTATTFLFLQCGQHLQRCAFYSHHFSLPAATVRPQPPPCGPRRRRAALAADGRPCRHRAATAATVRPSPPPCGHRWHRAAAAEVRLILQRGLSPSCCGPSSSCCCSSFSSCGSSSSSCGPSSSSCGPFSSS